MLEHTRIGDLVYIAHPLPKTVNLSSVVVSVKNGVFRDSRVKRYNHDSAASWLIDFVLTLLASASHSRSDFYIGIGSWFQTIPGLLLRRLRLVGTVVFWTTDFEPRQLKNGFTKSIYQFVDRMCAESADYTISPTKALIDFRTACGYDIDRRNALVVPYCLDSSYIEFPPIEDVLPDSIVYLGAFAGQHGFEILLDAVPEILKVKPNLKVTVISYEYMPKVYSDEISNRGLESVFENLGYISDQDKLGNIIKRRRIGVALYGSSFKRFNDPARTKNFLAKGVPVIVSGRLQINREIQEKMAGIVIPYEAKSLVEAVISLLDNEALYRKCRYNAYALAQKFACDGVFCDLTTRIGIK